MMTKQSLKLDLVQVCLVSTICLVGCQTVDTSSSVDRYLSSSGKAKNVILFIGDGMGVSTVTAARIFDGQTRGKTGEENVLSFETFPYTSMVKTYNTNQQVPDSAGTATAMHSGIKTRAGVIGIGPNAHRGDCNEAQANLVPTLGELAVKKNKAVGIVTTARLTHATPATVYAHSPERNWESDSEMPASAKKQGCQDIALQLTTFPFDVALGGGIERFQGSSLGGKRSNATSDIALDWMNANSGQIVLTAEQMKSARKDAPLLGLFSNGHMGYMADRTSKSKEPTLTEMTGTAISHLAGKNDGYYLMVEGGRIDHGHHSGRAGYALMETQEFANAVAYAVANTDPNETLILVTADHSHVFTIAGYPTRGNDILGLAKGNNERGEPTGQPILATDGLPYTTLGYWNGRGAAKQPRGYPETGVKATQHAAVPTGTGFDKTAKNSETHGGEDVTLYATGPGSDQVHGVLEQNRIFEIITAAFGWTK